MVQRPSAGRKKRCIGCGAVIPEVRVSAVPNVRTCVSCQKNAELVVRSGVSAVVAEDCIEVEPQEQVEMDGTQVLVGKWTANFMDVVARGNEVRGLIAQGEIRKARLLIQALPAEEQAAMVVMDEDPEDALSITGMDEEGNPGYSGAVAAHLPTELLAGMIAIDPEEDRYNTDLMRAMGPATFKRTVEETLDLLDNAEMRSDVAWEWLRALAEVKNASKRAELLSGVDASVLEEALLTRMGHLKMNETADYAEVDGMVVGFSRFRLFSGSGTAGLRLSSLVDDPEVGHVLDALYEADVALMSNLVCGAWERQLDQMPTEDSA